MKIPVGEEAPPAPPARCQQQSTVYITYGIHGLAGAYGGGWCVCGEHAAALFQRICPQMIHERPAREPTHKIYKPVEFTARAIVPDEGMMTTAVGRETRTTCQYKPLVDGPAQAEAPPRGPAGGALRDHLMDVEIEVNRRLTGAEKRLEANNERLTAAMVEAASAIGSLQHEVSELKAAREDRLADLGSHRVDADRRMTEAGERLMNVEIEVNRRLTGLQDQISGVKLDLDRLLNANNMNASSWFDLNARMVAAEKILDRHASTLKRFFEEDSNSALSNRVARLEDAMEATADALRDTWGASK